MCAGHHEKDSYGGDRPMDVIYAHPRENKYENDDSRLGRIHHNQHHVHAGTIHAGEEGDELSDLQNAPAIGVGVGYPHQQQIFNMSPLRRGGEGEVFTLSLPAAREEEAEGTTVSKQQCSDEGVDVEVSEWRTAPGRLNCAYALQSVRSYCRQHPYRVGIAAALVVGAIVVLIVYFATRPKPIIIRIDHERDRPTNPPARH